MAAEILFENDRVRVTRVRHGPGEVRAAAARNDRLIIPLTESSNARERAGIARTEHAIEKHEDGGDMLVVEFKGETAGVQRRR